MQAYLITLIAASMTVTLISLLFPSGERGGLLPYLRLFTALFLLCVLISPIRGAIMSLHDLLEGELTVPGIESPPEDPYREELELAMNAASTEYFAQALTRMLESRFGIEIGQIRCHVDWRLDSGQLSPSRVTVILSGRAIWKDAGAIEAYVENLLGCECDSAIE